MTPADIRGRADIVVVVGQYVRLQKRGTSFWAPCPFHKEKSASFHVEPVKQFYKCFGCGASGDVFSFLQAIESIDFRAAKERVASLFGIDLSSEPKQDAQSEKVTAELKDMMREAEHFRRIEKPPSLWINDHRPTPQQVLGAYMRRLDEDPGYRQWLRDDIRHCRKAVQILVGVIAQRQEKDCGDPIEW